ncbi:hypothetical protein QR680_017937 [Steinernema hermaphroditum]|uniref:Uncharacterized protein n=1 Tax=Steinernema hermaphroditum TaxID=289476 RepID=A0AA39LPK4_9BILA|nr:hypothetical protein QR680_017937 [Steinernema hermaphroditum]
MMTCSAKWASYLPREDRLEKGEKLREKKMSETILPIHQSTKRKEKSAEWTKVILELPWGKFCEEGGSIRNIEQALFPWQMGLQVAAQFSSPYTLLFLFGASEAFVTFRLRGNGRRTQ